MGRTTVGVSYTNFHGLQERLAALLQSKGYRNIVESNENVWKCGDGFWVAMKYIKIEFAENNTLLISGWIRPMGGGEQDLNGFIGAIPKKQVMNVISEMQSIVGNAVGQYIQQPMNPMQHPMFQVQQPVNPVPQPMNATPQPYVMNMKGRCTRCGAEVAADQRFCVVCGQQI